MGRFDVPISECNRSVGCIPFVRYISTMYCRLGQSSCPMWARGLIYDAGTVELPPCSFVMTDRFPEPLYGKLQVTVRYGSMLWQRKGIDAHPYRKRYGRISYRGCASESNDYPWCTGSRSSRGMVWGYPGSMWSVLYISFMGSGGPNYWVDDGDFERRQVDDISVCHHVLLVHD